MFVMASDPSDWDPLPEMGAAQHPGEQAVNPRLPVNAANAAASNSADGGEPMYPVWWEDERFARYLAAAAELPGLVPLGRLGLYKYVTIDSTYAMVERLLGSLDGLLGGTPASRLELLHGLRGDWTN